MAQRENVPRETGSPRRAGFPDPVRLEQFLDLHGVLLLPGATPEELSERVVHWVATFLGVAGAAVGVVQDGLYQLLAATGVGGGYRARYDGTSPRDGVLAAALADGRPQVLADRDVDLGAVTTVVLPFRAAELTGALHLVARAGTSLPDPDIDLARVLASLVGMALATSVQCRHLAEGARLKSEALTAMAHDLRSPLNALIGYATLLAEGAFGELAGEQGEVAAALERQALELIDLFGATLDVARLETGRRLPVRAEDVHLGDVFQGLEAGTFARPTRAGVLDWRPALDLPTLRTDRVKVKQIVQNLVDNALKHGVGGRVEVEATRAPGRDAVRITVRDTGPGIAPEVLPNLFQPFRGNGRGTGFGLYIVRAFTEALGGCVAAHSVPGDGTAIIVELPLAAPSAIPT